MVEDLCAECVEPAFGAACGEQDADSGVKRGRKRTCPDAAAVWHSRKDGQLIRVVPPDSVWSLQDFVGTALFLFPQATGQENMPAHLAARSVSVGAKP